MNVLQKAWAGFKAAVALVFPGAGSWGGAWGLTPGTRNNYRAMVGDGSGSSIVMSVVGWASRTYPEAPLQVVRRQKDNTLDILPDHPVTQLLERPNPAYGGALLWGALIADCILSGQGYLLKVRSQSGRPVQLWWVPSTLIHPAWPMDGSAWISHYVYTPNGTPIRLDVDDVIHLRPFGLDPANPRLGRCPLAAAYGEVWTDLEASQFTGAVLSNCGVPGVVLAPKDPTARMTDEAAERAKVAFNQKFTGDNRGQTFVAGGPMTVDVVSFSPQQMDLKSLRRLPEERVSALVGVPAVVAGLGAGLDHNTYSNISQAREAAYEEFLIPVQRVNTADLTTQLLAEFETDAAVMMRHDYSEVRALQPDLDALATRAVKLWAAGVAMRSEARAMLKLPTTKFDEVYAMSPRTILIYPDATPESIADAVTPAIAPSTPPTMAALPAAGETSQGKSALPGGPIHADDLDAADAFWREAVAQEPALADLADVLVAAPVGANGVNGVHHA